MATVRAFRALRYDTGVAGPLERLVAPPYDVVSADQRKELRVRSPYNVVHLTLPDSAEEAARTLAEWRGAGVVVRDAEPAFGVLQQDYVGPDGVARTRTGLVASLRLEPYERRVVLPHERTHRGPKEERLRILRATRTQLEPILLLYRGAPVVAPPTHAPDASVDGTRLWRVHDGGIAGELADRSLLIADGHHRYETALAFHAEDGGEASASMPVVLVSLDDPGLTIFPTHRVVRGGLAAAQGGEDLDGALARLAGAPYERAAAVLYRDGRASLLSSADVAFDAELVDGEVLRYTADGDDAVEAVDSGEADAAYLLRPPRVEDVFAAAERGEVMPQKTTYFFPKLVSGLLLAPLD